VTTADTYIRAELCTCRCRWQ